MSAMNHGSTRTTLIAPSQGREARPWSQRIFSFVALLYVHLWVLEGAIRKWIPYTSDVMYFARDTVLVFTLIGLALLLPERRPGAAIVFWALAGTLSIVTAAQVIGTGLGLGVALAGLRSYLAPLLLLYGAWAYRPPELARQIRTTLLVYSLPMLAIVLAQVVSDPGAPINREVLSDSASFVNFGVARASGTFSSPGGLTLFIPLAIALAFAHIEAGASRRSTVFGVASLGASVSIAMISGSRGTAFACAVVLLVAFARRIALGRFRDVLALAGFALLALSIFVILTRVLPDILGSFALRFEAAASSEDSSTRILNGAIGFFSQPIGFLGDGIGSHSQAGIRLGSPEPWIENDTVRWVAELGVLGYALAILRLCAGVWLLLVLVRSLRRPSAIVPMVSAAALPMVLAGGLTQTPTSQAYTSIVLSLILLESKWATHPMMTPNREPVDRPAT